MLKKSHEVAARLIIQWLAGLNALSADRLLHNVFQMVRTLGALDGSMNGLLFVFQAMVSVPVLLAGLPSSAFDTPLCSLRPGL